MEHHIKCKHTGKIKYKVTKCSDINKLLTTDVVCEEVNSNRSVKINQLYHINKINGKQCTDNLKRFDFYNKKSLLEPMLPDEVKNKIMNNTTQKQVYSQNILTQLIFEVLTPEQQNIIKSKLNNQVKPKGE